MTELKGIAVSPGVVIGRVFALDDARRPIPRRVVEARRIPGEVRRLEEALDRSVGELVALREQTEASMGPEAAKIFAFHIGMLSDPTLRGPMRRRIESERVTAEYAVYAELHDLAERFAAMRDAAFRTKVDDVRDLAHRVLRHLIGEHRHHLKDLNDQAVVAARDLTPSQAAALNREHVLAFVTEVGGRTSHTAIFARALRIPAVVGVAGLGEACLDQMRVIVDGDRGSVILDPDEATLEEYQGYIEQRRTFQMSLAELAELPSVTRDGVHVSLLANIEFPEEAPQVLELGGEGVGLYRTEFLYFVREREPTEEDHFAAYKACVERLRGRPLTIRTMDLGADKYTQEQSLNPERNPFLGLRSIRYCLRNLPMFRRQLRAILRASALGPIKVMFPLVGSVSEFRQAKFILLEVMEDLQDEGVEVDSRIEVGMMVEVPSAALLADAFAREADFFSIGTNDLVQYTLAVDRTNEQVADLFNPAHPAVLVLIRDVVRAGRRRNVPVSVCGESAGELEYALLLIGLGVRTLSVTPGSIPRLKRLIRSVSLPQCERMGKKALSLDSEVAVASYLRDQARKIIPEAFDGRAVD